MPQSLPRSIFPAPSLPRSVFPLSRYHHISHLCPWPRYLDILSPERLWQRLHPDVPRKLEPAPGEPAEEPPSISFTPSVQLSEYVKPLDR